MTALTAILAGPLLAGAIALGTVPVPPPPTVPFPPTIQLSLAGGGVQAGQHLMVQARVTGVGGIHEQGTVTFKIAGGSVMVGSMLDATSTATANLGFVTTAPTTVDASFVPTGGSVVTATAEATFRATPIPLTTFSTIEPATAGSPIRVHFAIATTPYPYAPDGHVDVTVGGGNSRSAFCILAKEAGGWNCTATVPPRPAGSVTFNVVLADSPYYSASYSQVVHVAAAPAAAGTSSKSAPSGTTATPTSAAPTNSASDSAEAAGKAPDDQTPRLSPVDGTSSATSGVNTLWLVLLAVVLAALIVAVLVVLRRMRRQAG